jgi:ribonuclease P/MRP protein subunit POP5
LRSKLPVLFPRRRYVVLRLDSEEEVGSRDLIKEIHSAQASLFGDMGAARNRLKLIYHEGSFGMLRCHHDDLQQTRAILASVYAVGGVRAALHIKGVAGTIKSAREKYIPQLSRSDAPDGRRRIELEEVSGCIVRIHGRKIDLCPDDANKTRGSDTRYLGLTSFDLIGGHDDADGTSDGLRQGYNGIQP